MCSNCYNNCTGITSDQCVRYTGIDVPVLGIKTGDSLSYVEQALITFTTSLIDGTGIKPTISSEIICTVVNQYLPTCTDLSAVDLFKALIQAVCDLQTQITAIDATITTLNSSYTVGCLEGVVGTDGTHAILQAAITKLCGTDTALTALALDVDTNYVKLADLNTLIAAYIASITPSTYYYTKMIPYTAVEYYGSLSNFDATGAGLGTWVNIYLCNGLNGTPDKRGRIPVGAISGVPGGTLASAVNPASDPTFNPNYAVGDTAYGTNKITLDTTQIPSHTHTAAVTDPGHSHETLVSTSYGGEFFPTFIHTGTSNVDSTSTPGSGNAGTDTATTGISVTNSNTGGGLAHDNKQPSLACYYIMFIP